MLNQNRRWCIDRIVQSKNCLHWNIGKVTVLHQESFREDQRRQRKYCPKKYRSRPIKEDIEWEKQKGGFWEYKSDSHPANVALAEMLLGLLQHELFGAQDRIRADKGKYKTKGEGAYFLPASWDKWVWGGCEIWSGSSYDLYGIMAYVIQIFLAD